ncbi:MAG: glycosyltransferase family 4 protein [Devosia sp.]|nr:glycosyltransferase family 4 protein [Devosia sp.]
MPDSVLFVLPRFGIGGAERVAADILVYLRDQGLVVGAVALDGTGTAAAATGWFGSVCPTWSIARDAQMGPQIERLVADLDVSVLVLCGRSPAFRLLPRLLGCRPGLRVASFQFNATQLRDEHSLYAPFIDMVIAESFDAAAALTASGGIQVPFQVIPSGVPVATLAARPRPPAAPEATVGYVGRFDRSKNPAGFLRMVHLLHRRNYRFVMAGPAPRHFRAPARITFAGPLLGEPLQQFIDAIDILVVPSRNDGRPLIIQEAQARGIAVVATAVGGIPELVETEVTGLLCPAGDARALAAAVDRLATDRALRLRLGQAGRARVEREGDIAMALPRYAAAITGWSGRAAG